MVNEPDTVAKTVTSENFAYGGSPTSPLSSSTRGFASGGMMGGLSSMMPMMGGMMGGSSGGSSPPPQSPSGGQMSVAGNGTVVGGSGMQSPGQVSSPTSPVNSALGSSVYGSLINKIIGNSINNPGQSTQLQSMDPSTFSGIGGGDSSGIADVGMSADEAGFMASGGMVHRYANGGAANFNANDAGYAEGGDIAPDQQQQPQQSQPSPDQQQSMQNQQIANQVVPKDGTADNVDAKLSKGEFVMDAATVQFWGMGKLIQMQDKAHEAIAKHLEKQNAQQQQQAGQRPGLAAPPQGQQQQMPQQLPPQAAAQPNASQQRIAQTATPPKAPPPSPSPFSLGG
jgi:hypothetical protein